MENASRVIIEQKSACDMFVKNQSMCSLFLDTEAFTNRSGEPKEESDVRTTIYEKKYGKIKWVKSTVPHWTKN